MSDNLEDLRKLRARSKATAEELQVKMVDFSVTPSDDPSDPDILNITFMLSAESMETVEETEQRKIDTDFDAIFAAEFGDIDTFADDDTKALLEKEQADKDRRAAEVERILREMGE